MVLNRAIKLESVLSPSELEVQRMANLSISVSSMEARDLVVSQLAINDAADVCILIRNEPALLMDHFTDRANYLRIVNHHNHVKCCLRFPLPGPIIGWRYNRLDVHSYVHALTIFKTDLIELWSESKLCSQQANTVRSGQLSEPL